MKEFTRYGDEWKKEMNKWTKTRLIETFAKIGKQIEKLEAGIEELISGKGIRDLEAVADAALKVTNECLVSDADWCEYYKPLDDALKEAGKLK